MRGRADHIGRRRQHVAAAVAVIIHGVVEIVPRQKLRLTEFARPRADHLRHGEIAAVDDLQGCDQFGAEHVGAAAIIGERRQRLDRRQLARVGAEVAFQSPERRDHCTRHTIFALGAGERLGVRLQPLLALLHAIVGRHARGELDEALAEHALAAVARNDARVHRLAVARPAPARSNSRPASARLA